MNHSNKGFVSEIDQFLINYDKQHKELSESQKNEKATYERLHQLRDTVNHSIQASLPNEWL